MGDYLRFLNFYLNEKYKAQNLFCFAPINILEDHQNGPELFGREWLRKEAGLQSVPMNGSAS